MTYAAQMKGIKSIVIVPFGNNPDKNRAMEAYGAELIEHGKDFDEALGYAQSLAEERGWHLFPSIHHHLIQGVGTYSLELFNSAPSLDTLYVPVGLGSGICGTIAARNAMGVNTTIVGVVAANAATYAHSFEAKKPVSFVFLIPRHWSTCSIMSTGL